MALDPRAGKPATRDQLIDVARLEREFLERTPDAADPRQRVSFGTSGHRGTPLDGTFTEAHILAITQAICEYRAGKGIDGPLYMGKDTHALSAPAQRTALEVLAANGVETVIQRDDGVTPTPVDLARDPRPQPRPHASGSPTASSSRRRTTRPRTAASSTTRRTAARPTPTSPAGSRTAPTSCSRAGNAGVKRTHDRGGSDGADDAAGRLRRRRTSTTCRTSSTWTRSAAPSLSIGVDPLGGASLPYWEPIAATHGLNITVVNDRIDPTLRAS